MPRLRGLWGTNTSIFETQAKASLVCWSFWQGAETVGIPEPKPIQSGLGTAE